MKITFKSFGCRTNQIEIESLKQHLLRAGFDISDSEPDYVIINSCCVTEKAEKDVEKFIRKTLKSSSSVIILTGCLATLKKGVFEKEERIKVFENSKKHTIYNFLSGDSLDLSWFPVNERGERTRAFIKVQEGCLMKCSYCIVPYLRNEVKSKRFDDVINEVKILLEKGVKEIVLSGTRLGSYSWEGKKLSDLIESILKIDKRFRIRLSSIEPWEIDEKLVDVMSDSKLCRHLHIPLQSGCDRILKLMKRPYTKKFFEDKLDYIRKKINDIAIYSDIIVAFPTETEDEFNETANFVRDLSLSGLHCFTYSPRPYTEAFELEDLDLKLKNERSKIMRGVDNYLREKFLQSKIGKILDVLILEREKNYFSGLSSEFIDVIVEENVKGNSFEKLKAVKRIGRKILCSR